MAESKTGRCENVESPLTFQGTALHAGESPLVRRQKRPRTEIIAWNNQQRDMRLSGLLPTIHEYGRTTSRSSCRATASFITGSMSTIWKSNASDYASRTKMRRPVITARSW